MLATVYRPAAECEDNKEGNSRQKCIHGKLPLVKEVGLFNVSVYDVTLTYRCKNLPIMSYTTQIAELRNSATCSAAILSYQQTLMRSSLLLLHYWPQC